jgi:hypothetical protein
MLTLIEKENNNKIDEQTKEDNTINQNIEKQEIISKINDYLKSFNQEIEKDNLVIIFSPVYKFILNSKRVRIKQFDETAFGRNFDLCVEIDGFGFTNASMREKCYNYVTKNNLTIVKIK